MASITDNMYKADYDNEAFDNTAAVETEAIGATVRIIRPAQSAQSNTTIPADGSHPFIPVLQTKFEHTLSLLCSSYLAADTTYPPHMERPIQFESETVLGYDISEGFNDCNPEYRLILQSASPFVSDEELVDICEDHHGDTLFAEEDSLENKIRAILECGVLKYPWHRCFSPVFRRAYEEYVKRGGDRVKAMLSRKGNSAMYHRGDRWYTMHWHTNGDMRYSRRGMRDVRDDRIDDAVNTANAEAAAAIGEETPAAAAQATPAQVTYEYHDQYLADVLRFNEEKPLCLNKMTPTMLAALRRNICALNRGRPNQPVIEALVGFYGNVGDNINCHCRMHRARYSYTYGIGPYDVYYSPAAMIRLYIGLNSKNVAMVRDVTNALNIHIPHLRRKIYLYIVPQYPLIDNFLRYLREHHCKCDAMFVE